MLKLDTKNTINKKTFQTYKSRIEKAKESLLKKKYAEFLLLPTQNTTQLANQIAPLKKRFSDIVIIGMGGSVLGSQMLFHSLGKNNSKPPYIHFVDNIDPDLISSFEKPLTKKKTLFLFISKSGDTLETVTLFSLIQKGAQKWFGKKWQSHLKVITENEDGTLFKQATKNKLEIFKMPKYVAGRFSILSTAGLIPAILMDININKLLLGAARASGSKTADNLAILLYHMYTKKKKSTLALFPYIDRFEYFNKWAVQLIAESLGKTSKKGPLPIGLIGAKDQHSMLQLLLDGPKDKWVLFTETATRQKDYVANKIKFSQILEAQKKGTEHALKQKHVPSATLTLEKIDEENLGELIMTFEIAVALAGELFKVNAFNQPSVELGKKVTKKLLNI
jgi:glucose-6-phosphate isomerase